MDFDFFLPPHEGVLIYTTRGPSYLHRTRASLPSPYEGVFTFFTRRRLLNWAYDPNYQKRVSSFFTHRCLLDWAYDLSYQKRFSPFFTHRCLLDWAYDPNCQKRVSSFFAHRCLLDWAYDPNYQKRVSPLTVNFFKFSFFHMDLPSTTSPSKFSYYLFFPFGLTLDCQFLQIFTSFNKIDYLDFFLEKSYLNLLQKYIPVFHFFFFFLMLSLIPLSAFHCLNPVGFPFFIFPYFQQNGKMQMLCPDCADEML